MAKSSDSQKLIFCHKFGKSLRCSWTYALFCHCRQTSTVIHLDLPYCVVMQIKLRRQKLIFILLFRYILSYFSPQRSSQMCISKEQIKVGGYKKLKLKSIIKIRAHEPGLRPKDHGTSHSPLAMLSFLMTHSKEGCIRNSAQIFGWN